MSFVPALGSGRLQPPVERARLDAGSEIEAIQRAHDLKRLVPALGVIIAVASMFSTSALDDWVCAMMILAASLVPVQMWARRSVLGLPVWPVVSFLSFLVYGAPYVTSHPLTRAYSSEEKIAAAITIASVLLVTTFVWSFVGRQRPLAPVNGWIMPSGRGTRYFLSFMALACAFQLNAVLWVVDIPSETFGVLRAVILSLCTLAFFALSYDVGRGLLSRTHTVVFIVLLLAYLAANVLTLYLYTAMQIAFVAFLGYFLGGGRPPWRAMIAVAITLSILQAGKAPIRTTYWGTEQSIKTLGDAGTLLADWFTEGVYGLFSDPEPSSDSLVQRGGMTHMLLKAQTESPQFVPFLDGASYTGIPALLIPRFIWPERPTTHSMLRELNVHYGLLTLDETDVTSIAWGLVAEAFANFGYAGCFGLAVVMGIALGQVQKHCGRFPVKSVRGLFALTVVSCLVNLEANAATLLTTFAQSAVSLVLLVVIAMRKQTIVG